MRPYGEVTRFEQYTTDSFEGVSFPLPLDSLPGFDSEDQDASD